MIEIYFVRIRVAPVMFPLDIRQASQERIGFNFHALSAEVVLDCKSNNGHRYCALLIDSINWIYVSRAEASSAVVSAVTRIALAAV